MTFLVVKNTLTLASNISFVFSTLFNLINDYYNVKINRNFLKVYETINWILYFLSVVFAAPDYMPNAIQKP
jgi:hypothetical protein